MLKSLLVVLALALSMLAGTAYAQPSVDDTCTRFLGENSYSCGVVCDDDTYPDDCLSFHTNSPGHFEMISGRVQEEFIVCINACCEYAGRRVIRVRAGRRHVYEVPWRQQL